MVQQIADLLNEDIPIVDQKFACISFLSPEKLLADKNLFMFNKFVEKWDFSKSMEKFNQFIAFLSYKYKLDQSKVCDDFKEFVTQENKSLNQISLSDDYKTFIEQNEAILQSEFDEANSFQTNVRGIKIRGSFRTQQEAELRCKVLREFDPNHDVFVGPVGLWMPWDPEAYKTGRVEYLEHELNQLMHQKNTNESDAKNTFNTRVNTAKHNAIQDNINKASKHGNKLTQNIHKDGTLFSVANNEETEQTPISNDETPSNDEGDADETPSKDEGETDETPSKDEGDTDETPSNDEGDTDETPSKDEGDTDETPSKDEGDTDETPSTNEHEKDEHEKDETPSKNEHTNAND
jgi:hypothetical protein